MSRSIYLLMPVLVLTVSVLSCGKASSKTIPDNDSVAITDVTTLNDDDTFLSDTIDISIQNDALMPEETNETADAADSQDDNDLTIQDDILLSEENNETTDTADSQSDNDLTIQDDMADNDIYMDDSDADGIVFTSGPLVEMNPNPLAPLTGVVELSTSIATRVTVTVTGTEGSREFTFSELGKTHRHPILGLLPGGSYTVQVSVSAENGEIKAFPNSFKLDVPALPSDFPIINVDISVPDKMTKGYTFLAVSRVITSSLPSELWGNLIAIDEKGRIVWYFTTTTIEPLHGVTFLDSGGILLQFSKKLLIVDRFGDTLKGWTTATTAGFVTVNNVKGFSHSAEEMPSGNILAVTTESIQVNNYPTSETDPNAPTASASVLYNNVVEFSPDGQTINNWILRDMLDPLRLGYGFLIPVKEWGHTNYATYLPDEDSVIVSVRNQSCIIKIDHSTGNIVWILGPHDKWKPQFTKYLLTPVGAPFEWMWYQHNPKLMPDGHFIVFDNGDYRAFPYDTPMAAANNRSRAVEYEIDETAMTVRQVWDWGPTGSEKIYAATMGDVEYLPQSDTVLLLFGGIYKNVNGVPLDPSQDIYGSARLIEVTHTATPETVFEVRLDDLSNSPRGWLVHRALRQPSIYPNNYLIP